MELLKIDFGEWEVAFGYALFEFLAQGDDMLRLPEIFRKEAGGSRP